ncbi:MAG: D-aminoacylase [Candidatus Aminicenantes bacterium]|nr:D-aminoacylase [Candidatus Aminicenantes bacterium]
MKQNFLKLGAGLVFILIFLILLVFNCRPAGKIFDLAVVNGRVVDGSGNPWFRADIGIKDGKIVALKRRINQEEAKEVLEAEGLVVAPGFIDIHTHADRNILEIPSCENYLSQGVTTLIGGNCGGHEFPLAELFARLKKQGMSCNFGSLAGHNTIRERVMGMKMSPPTAEEMSKMKDLLRMEMKAGALGFSTGLAYLPGTYSSTEELIELASVLRETGGFYATHMRNQGKKIKQAIEESIAIGEKNGIPVQISHIKLADEEVWNQIGLITGPVEEARARGVEVTLDEYPYTATSSGFTSSFPQDVFEGGKEKFLERMNDPEIYQRVKATIIKNRLTSSRGIDKLSAIIIARSRKFPDYEGKTLRQILESKGQEPTPDNGADLIIEIVKEGDASAIFFQMDEKDVEALMKLPYTMIGSDGGLQEMGKGHPHPRNYGTFPRILGEYVRNRQVLTLEEAIRKMTSLPAQTMRLKDRGLIREGMYADLVLFDPETVSDMATFQNPHQYSRGIVYVLVNGQVVWQKGKYTGKKPGKIIYGPAFSGQ